MTRKLRVRQAQTIVPFGVGAIVETQGEAFVAADISHWPVSSCPWVDSPRLAAGLGVTGFKALPSAKNDFFDSPDGVGAPCVRFPAWLFCGACRRMRRWGVADEQPGTAPLCPACPTPQALGPMRFVQICESGHMDDVDWWWWAHSRATTDCQRSTQRLSFLVDHSSIGLEALSVMCRACDSSRDLLQLLDRGRTRCTGHHPWQGRHEAAHCTEHARVVQRNAGNVYYAMTLSALDIPAPTAEAGAVDPQIASRIRSDDLWPGLCRADDPHRAAMLTTMICEGQPGVSPEDVAALLRQENGGTETERTHPRKDRPSTAADMSWEEWAALNTSTAVNDKHFTVRPVRFGPEGPPTESERLLRGRIERVVVADRLREVRALRGFCRVQPSPRRMVGVDTTGRRSWLPAVEVFGEGVFLAFSEDALSRWEEQPSVRERVRGLESDLNAAFQMDRLSGMVGDALLPRLPLLHTFAHLLIRQLSFESGYGTASLRERVYARPGEGGHQAGVLIYTAAGDADGTLGGLAHQGASARLTEILLRLLEAGAWCSADPLCAEHGARGFANLNRAACHACALLPETSCEAGNALLDRVLLVGAPGITGFFQPVIDAARRQAAGIARGEDPV
ncbi:hypothetical protein A6A08_07055 [Nocardiopsis sp. TSRI0078]|uniref:DUF1998 domain-containing protein n=1 Tax=unclassified Nocardiopsis TaxID=2649073 RepID=UPI00093DE2D6|nr:DUF1998 domain-containing protein [Nocardiopsis sp. TSRI0078]OKI17018.1 hypothetical protein A6A08_07055 [Nocardiopsis sp. TSRI0078]